MILYILTFVLFILLSPGVLYKIPKNMSLMKITIAHATIFTILFILLQHFMISEQIENFKDGEMEDETEGETEGEMEGEMEGGETDDEMEGEKDVMSEKISQIFSKMSEVELKKFNEFTIEEFDAFTKYINSMSTPDIEKFILLPIDEILAKIQ